MTIDSMLFYIGIAAGVGVVAILVPGYFQRLLKDTPKQAKSLMR